MDISRSGDGSGTARTQHDRRPDLLRLGPWHGRFHTGETGANDGITVAAGYDRIAATKPLPDTAPAAVYGKTVTAVFPDCYYTQEPYGSGTRVVTSRPMALGDRVDLAGVMSGGGGERTLNADTVIVTAVGVGTAVNPRALPNKAVGGAGIPPYVPDFVPAYGGPNNLSTLVSISGKILSRDSAENSMMIDDGSETPIKCLLLSDVDLLHDGRYAVVTGVVTSEPSGPGLQRVVRMRPQDVVREF